MSACDGHDATLTQIEKRVQQFEDNSTKMDPQEAAKMSSELQQDVDVSKQMHLELSCMYMYITYYNLKYMCCTENL